MSTRFAGVYILDNPYHLDYMYEYRIPVALEEDIYPGVFVTVPFGPSNHRRLGVVWELRETQGRKELKGIELVSPEHMALDSGMMGLCAFMKQRLLCTIGDAVKSMMPASALSRLVTLYSVTSYIPTDSDDIHSSDLLLYRRISDAGEVPFLNLRREYGSGVENRLRRLLACGALQKRVILKDASKGLVERRWFFAKSDAVIRSLISGEENGGIKLTSEKQVAILQALLDEGCPMRADEIKERTGVGDSPIRTLEEKGLLASEEVRLDRNPYSEIPFTGQTPLTLNEEQTEAVEALTSLAFSGEPKAALLHGVTGSGKTCVMTALMDRLLAAGKGVILLLPEIALTPQTVSIFCARYGSRVSVMHSGLSAGERYDAYCRIRQGLSDVVIGTRSAVFAPVKNLGAILIDEEQEHTYKSDQNPKYHARDIARYRCAKGNALMLLASATPSIESYHKAQEGLYTLIRLRNRYGNAKLPRVIVADMRGEEQGGNTSPLGERLLRELCRVQEQKEQSILFLNRRGYNHFFSCRSCGEAVMCPSCSVAMTYHTKKRDYSDGHLVCHWCGKKMPPPKLCPTCQSEHLARMGFGTQRVEEELEKLLPKSNILRMDTDTTGTKLAYDNLLGVFRRHEADVLLGTQMVTKGHDFPDVTLVGVLLADASLYLDDYRANERTFSMLTQVIGRAGRGDKEGLAVIQTNNPDSEVIRLACEQNYEAFYDREIRLRKLLTFPPFCDIALVTVTGLLETELLLAVEHLARDLEDLSKGPYRDVPLISFGPFEAPVYRVDNRYRMRIVIKCKLNKRTLEMLSALVTGFASNVGKRLNISIDLNPSSL